MTHKGAHTGTDLWQRSTWVRVPEARQQQSTVWATHAAQSRKEKGEFLK